MGPNLCAHEPAHLQDPEYHDVDAGITELHAVMDTVIYKVSAAEMQPALIISQMQKNVLITEKTVCLYDNVPLTIVHQLT